ncbi:hypothetical protein LUX05_06200 [Streptomyces somaliensis]|uniref:hypothetical protein n=1 Tax=Streptomyces somaliensis TaxID=78355 RepID=UPI0034E97400|nr:hypothetical protein [Streptomyces somaliensis]MCP9973861.1 hypothetical protein [Streptomyces somaliensis]
MNTAARNGLYGAALAATFAATYGLGATAGPLDGGADTPRHGTHPEKTVTDHDGWHTARTAALPGGLQVSQDGYTLDLRTPRVTAGRESPLRFVIRDAAGKAVTDYTEAHDEDLHLILASRDLNTFRHLHPALGADGTWSVPVNLPAAGDYRVFADFTPDRKGAGALTLGADLAATGPYRPRALPPRRTTAEVDGYTVTLEGRLTPGNAGGLRLTVAKDGEPVTDLEPYLGAYGHLVALRSGDLAYLHVHPEGEPGDGTTRPGPGVSFTATAPSPGAYRLFLDFKHRGTVRTAAFTVHTSPAGAATGRPEPHATGGTDGPGGHTEPGGHTGSGHGGHP